MIEVSVDMLKAVYLYKTKTSNMTDAELAKRIIELHEASKPKPEPVGYIYPSSYAKALRNESSCKMFVVPVTNLDTGEESSLPLYTTPPTREPLSEGEINNIVFSLSKGSTLFDSARAVEQAHGIGVTK